MAIRAHYVGQFTVRFSGLDLKAHSRQEWRDAATKAGFILQHGKIAPSFAREKVGGNSALGAITLEYIRWKVRHGRSPLRGHNTGFTQETLEADKQLFEVGRVTDVGSIVVRFREDWLRARVKYIVHYEKQKVDRDGILVLARSWLNDALEPFRALEDAPPMKMAA